MQRRTLFLSALVAALPGLEGATAAQLSDSTNTNIMPAATTQPELSTDAFSTLERMTKRDLAKALTAIDLGTARLVAVSALTAIGDEIALEHVLETALAEGVEADRLHEAMMQAMPYSGIPSTLRAERVLARVLEARGLAFPKAGRGPSDETRFEDGLRIQKGIFGDAIDTMHKNAKVDERHLMVNLLTEFCFGDGYARGVLDTPVRELLTFATIAAMGGCEPQVKAHAGGNLLVGNTRAMLLDTLVVLVPYIGFPKTLNALSMVNEVSKS